MVVSCTLLSSATLVSPRQSPHGVLGHLAGLHGWHESWTLSKTIYQKKNSLSFHHFESKENQSIKATVLELKETVVPPNGSFKSKLLTTRYTETKTKVVGRTSTSAVVSPQQATPSTPHVSQPFGLWDPVSDTTMPQKQKGQCEHIFITSTSHHAKYNQGLVQCFCLWFLNVILIFVSKYFLVFCPGNLFILR